MLPGAWFLAARLLEGPAIYYNIETAFSLTNSNPTTTSEAMKLTISERNGLFF